LSAVNPEEAAGSTHHTTSAEVRKEIEEITARLIKDVFESCGTRDIERLSVSCNRALVNGPDDHQRLVMRSLYRASIDSLRATGIANWRDLSTGQVAEAMQVEHDVIAGIIITRRPGARFVEDPNEPLEF
jgi:hypothetical protein